MEASWPPKKFKRVSSAGKVIASIFWNSQGVIMVDYREDGRTINGACFADDLRRLRETIVKKRRGMLTRGFLLLQDNTQAHTSQTDMAAGTKCSFEVLPHSPYSPDLTTSDFYLFPNLKTNLRGRNFESSEGVIDIVDIVEGPETRTRKKASILNG